MYLHFKISLLITNIGDIMGSQFIFLFLYVKEAEWDKWQDVNSHRQEEISQGDRKAEAQRADRNRTRFYD